MKTRIKFCGLTSQQNVTEAVCAGADALGFVFYEPSPRSVSVIQAQKLMQSVPAFVSIVALVVNPSLDLIKKIHSLPVDCIQFHGAETPSQCHQMSQSFGSKRWIKALQVKPNVDLIKEAEEFIQAGASAILLDGYDPAQPSITGGTGKAFDWQVVADLLKNTHIPIILAGGLTVDNVADAIAQAQPYAVDVSGGIEQTDVTGKQFKGIKDMHKMTSFIQNVI